MIRHLSYALGLNETTAKLTNEVDCLVDGLDMPPYSSGEASLYYLAASSTHLGTMCGNGHYVTQVRSAVSGEWLLLDDEDVTLLGPAAVRDPGVYMLWYHRRDLRPASWGDPPQSEAQRGPHI